MGSDAQTAGEHGAGESRRHFRSAHKLRWPVELEPVHRSGVQSSEAPARIRAEALGVSLGGTFVVCDELLPVDTDLHLWLWPQVPLPRGPQVPLPRGPGDPLPRGPRVLRLLARVRWINAAPGATPGAARGELPRGFGVAFRALTAADEIALHGSFSRSAASAKVI